MNNIMPTLKMIDKTVKEINSEGGKPDLTSIIQELEAYLNQINELKVQGKSCLDKLLGCIIGIEMIIGEEDKDG